MSDEERKAFEAAPPPPPMGVDRVEFRRAMNDSHREIGERFTRLQEEAGIVLYSLGVWCAVTGFFLVKDAGK